MPVITTEQVESLIKTSINNIKSHFRNIDGKHGWHQYLGNEKVGNIATSQALILLNKFNEDFDKKNLAIDFLRSSQLKNKNNNEVDGGWTYVSNFSNIPTTEATCWALSALCDFSANDKVVKKGISWVINNHIVSNNDSGWGTTKRDVSRLYSTCLALKVLHLYKLHKSTQFEKGLNWLIKSQNPDKGWGERHGYKSTITHTSHAILTLIEIGYSNSSIINGGVEWLIENFKSINDQTWKDKSGYQEIVEFDYCLDNKINHHRLFYYHMPLPYAIMALIKTGNINNKIVFDGLNELIQNNNEGYWKHPHLETIKVKPLWSIFDTLSTFKTLIDYCSDWKFIKEIQFRKNKLILVRNTSPFNLMNFWNNFILGIWGKIFAIILASFVVIFVSDAFPSWITKNYVSIILLPLIVELLGYYLTEIKRNK